MIQHRQIDWEDAKAQAAALSNAALSDKIQSIRNVLDAADLLDRETGDNRGGYYRDVLSVLVTEQKTRNIEPAARKWRTQVERLTCWLDSDQREKLEPLLDQAVMNWGWKS